MALIRKRNCARRKPQRGRTRKTGRKKQQQPSLRGLHDSTAREAIYRSRLPQLKDPLEEVRVTRPFEHHLATSDNPAQPCMVADPMPEDYVFVARGDPYVTRNCKLHSKAEADTVFIVYVNNSQLCAFNQANRRTWQDNKAKDKLGIRVRKATLDNVTKLASQTADKRAAAVLAQDNRDEKKAKTVLEETFPGIPPKCAKKILQHAFLKGSGRVGRSTKQPETSKARLAVEAHIRHHHTPYDTLLDNGTDRHDARAAVWKTVQTLRDQWARKSKSAESNPATEESSEEESPRRPTRLRSRKPLPEIIVID